MLTIRILDKLSAMRRIFASMSSDHDMGGLFTLETLINDTLPMLIDAASFAPEFCEEIAEAMMNNISEIIVSPEINHDDRDEMLRLYLLVGDKSGYFAHETFEEETPTRKTEVLSKLAERSQANKRNKNSGKTRFMV